MYFPEAIWVQIIVNSRKSRINLPFILTSIQSLFAGTLKIRNSISIVFLNGPFILKSLSVIVQGMVIVAFNGTYCTKPSSSVTTPRMTLY